MPEQLVASVPGRLRAAPWSRRMTWPLACMLPLCGIPAAAFSQGASAALRACAAETDSAKRLACYDREMARLPATPAQAERPAPPAAVPAKPDVASSPAPASSATPTQASNSIATQAPPAADAKSAEATHTETSGSHWTSSLKKIFGGDSSQVTAHVASLDRWPNAMVLHLDNGQVWHQIGRASGDLSLHAGDSVTIEKHLGSYWLSSRYVSNMQVRLDPQQAQ